MTQGVCCQVDSKSDKSSRRQRGQNHRPLIVVQEFLRLSEGDCKRQAAWRRIHGFGWPGEGPNHAEHGESRRRTPTYWRMAQKGLLPGKVSAAPKAASHGKWRPGGLDGLRDDKTLRVWAGAQQANNGCRETNATVLPSRACSWSGAARLVCSQRRKGLSRTSSG